MVPTHACDAAWRQLHSWIVHSRRHEPHHARAENGDNVANKPLLGPPNKFANRNPENEPSAATATQDADIGFIHDSLFLRDTSNPRFAGTVGSGDGEPSSAGLVDRGVYAARVIPSGETLLRIPAHYVISGQRFPTNFPAKPSVNESGQETVLSERSRPSNESDDSCMASPWLRCVAALMMLLFSHHDRTADVKILPPIASSCNDRDRLYQFYQPYLESLPTEYDTLLAWTDTELRSYLAGTLLLDQCIHGSHEPHGSIAASQVQLLRDRYRDQIRPYLEYCGIVSPSPPIAPQEFQIFRVSCECITTRAFHLDTNGNSLEFSQHQQSVIVAREPQDTDYTGPFMIPVVDLLNHSSLSGAKCTTLSRHSDGSFQMVAERSVAANEQILHSYGVGLNAHQFLQTFGFVPLEVMKRRAVAFESAGISDSDCFLDSPITPVILSKKEILDACWQVVDAGMPGHIASLMKESLNTKDETWIIQDDAAVREQRSASFLPEEFIVSTTSTPSTASLLSDEIVTVASLPFLPADAYQEAVLDNVKGVALLDASILEDFFLGQLVCAALLRVVGARMKAYEAGPSAGVRTEETLEDVSLLAHLLNVDQEKGGAASLTTRRRMYGLTVRIEEKTTLSAFRQEILGVLARLQEVEDDPEASDECEQDTVGGSKRHRIHK
jgi:SET domain